MTQLRALRFTEASGWTPLLVMASDPKEPRFGALGQGLRKDLQARAGG